MPPGNKRLPVGHLGHGSIYNLLIVANVPVSLWVMESKISLTLNDHPAIVGVRVVGQVKVLTFAKADGSVGTLLEYDVCASRPGNREYATVPNVVDHRRIADGSGRSETSSRSLCGGGSLVVVDVDDHFELGRVSNRLL